MLVETKGGQVGRDPTIEALNADLKALELTRLGVGGTGRPSTALGLAEWLAG